MKINLIFAAVKSSWVLCHVVLLEWTDVSEVCTASHHQGHTSETSVHSSETTQRYIPEDSKLHI
jgi:hypothetical protein